MRTILVIFDSLNRNSLGCYGGRSGLTPNIDRFANRSVVFDRHYVGGLPCMPARRDMHTGRLTFLHRAWGPLEPFDNSYCRELGQRAFTPTWSPITLTISRMAAPAMPRRSKLGISSAGKRAIHSGVSSVPTSRASANTTTRRNIPWKRSIRTGSPKLAPTVWPGSGCRTA